VARRLGDLARTQEARLMLTPREKKLLARLAAEGKATKLAPGEIIPARDLDSFELLFTARDTEDPQSMYAVITPKGRKILATEESAQKSNKKPPLGFLD